MKTYGFHDGFCQNPRVLTVFSELPKVFTGNFTRIFMKSKGFYKGFAKDLVFSQRFHEIPKVFMFL